MVLDHPADDEIEISIFGPGYGESILLHIGSRKWITIDSCIDPGNPNIIVPLDYLAKIGVDCGTEIERVIATHWHDDHVKGISNVFKSAKSARFCCANAFTQKEFIDYAVAYATNDSTSSLGTGTKEIKSVISQLKERKEHPLYTSVDHLIYNGGDTDIFSLSPSNERVGQFLKRVALAMPVSGETRVRAADLRPNDIAVAILFKAPNGSVLLGADLEEANGKGWTVILNEAQCLKGGLSNVFKVPHHGSETGHCDEVWDKMLTSDSIAVLTPWERGGNSLPQPSDIERILSRTVKAYSTATPISLSPDKRPQTIEKRLKERGIKIRRAHPKLGHVRLRRRKSDAEWKVEMDGTAVELKQLLPKQN